MVIGLIIQVLISIHGLVAPVLTIELMQDDISNVKQRLKESNLNKSMVCNFLYHWICRILISLQPVLLIQCTTYF